MISELQTALRAVENAGDWTDPRHIVPRALKLVGIPAERLIESANKTTALVGDYAVKSCAPHQIEQFLALAGRIRQYAARVVCKGRCWMIQERADKTGPQHQLQKNLAHVGAHDITHNCGVTKDGRTVAFDGYLIHIDH